MHTMWQKIRNFALRSLPYLVSIAGGVMLFSISLDNVKDPAVEALISNISASLLAIPLVFLLYDYTTTRVSRQLQKTLAGGMNDKINTIILHVILVLRKMLGVRGHIIRANISAIRRIPKTTMADKIRIREESIDALHEYYQELINLVLNYGKENVLSPEQLYLLTELAHDMSQMVGACRVGKNKRIIAQYIHNITEEIIDWLNSGETVSQGFERMISTTDTGKKIVLPNNFS